MQIKRYEVLDIKEAIKLIKRDLGEDAVIISTRQVNKSEEFGFFGKPFLEVVAAVDYNEEISVNGREENDKKLNYDLITPLYDDIKFLKDNFESIVEDKVIFVLNSKFDEVKSILDEIRFSVDFLKKDKSGSKIIDEELFSYLDRLGFDRRISVKLNDIFFKDLVLKNFTPNEKIEYFLKFFKKLIERRLEKKTALASTIDGKLLVSLAGNNGVGKTSTAAKLCAKYIFEKNKPVSLCSLDILKISSNEALKNYAKKLKIDFASIKNPEEFKSFISNADSDIVIIDSFGVNHNNLYQLNNLAKFFDIYKGKIKNCLLLSAQTKSHDAMRIYESFNNKIGLNSLIITKVDESYSIGNLAGIFLQSDLTIDYLTNGENVPENIEEAKLDNLFNLFFPRPEI
ncbi:MAG: flagellar biosynthesis protein FlhF [bacterium]